MYAHVFSVSFPIKVVEDLRASNGSSESARFSYACMCLLIPCKKCTLIKIAGKWTAKTLDRATSGRQPRDKRHMKGSEKCPIIKIHTNKTTTIINYQTLFPLLRRGLGRGLKTDEPMGYNRHKLS